MSTCDQIMEELKALGSPSIKKVLINHGALEPFYGVKVEELKNILKRERINYPLALELYNTGVSDAMYLAALMVDDSKMTMSDLQNWVERAHWSLLSESGVPWVAASSNHGWEAAALWIESDSELIASAGWCTFRSIIGVTPDSALNLDYLKSLLNRVATSIHAQPNRVRSCMNGFVISVGTHVLPLATDALETANKIGKVSVYMGKTACKVPDAPTLIEKAISSGTAGKKRKMIKC